MSQEQDKPLEELRVVLVDDHAMFRAGVRHEIGKLCQVVGEGHDVASSVATILETKPDVVLLDVHLPGGGGAEVIKQVAAKAPDVKFLALSVSDAAEDVIGVIRAGARGYVTKTISGPELIDAVRRVHDGDAVFSPRLAGFVLDAFCAPDKHVGVGVVDAPEKDAAVEERVAAGESAHEDMEDPDDDVLDALTRRELEVLRLLARGYTYKEIASDLFISVKTVETHASNILRKTQQSNRYALSRWARERDLD